MAVYCFISLLLKTEHHVFFEYGRWPPGMVGSYRKKLSGSWVMNLQDFVRLLSTPESQKYFENDYKSQIEGKK